MPAVPAVGLTTRSQALTYFLYLGNRLTSVSDHPTLAEAYRAAIDLLRSNDSLYCCNIVDSDRPRFEVLVYVTRYDLEHPRQELL